MYSSALPEDGTPVTISLTTVRFEPDGEGTRLVLEEQDTFLDGREDPRWRESGTAAWLDALGDELVRSG